MQANKVSIVGDKENAVAQHGGAAVCPLLGVARDASRRRAWPRIIPNLSAGTGINRLHLVRTGDVHHAIDHQGRCFQAEVGQGMDPCRPQRAHVLHIDAAKGTVAVTVDISGIGRPIAGPGVKDLVDRLWRHALLRRGIGPDGNSSQGTQERHQVEVLLRACRRMRA